MTMEIVEQRWNAYQMAFGPVDAGERQRLLEECVAENVAYSNPDGQGEGRKDFTLHVADFQQQFPGAWFRGNKLIVHHGQLLAEWTMFNGDGTEFLTGNSYARFNEQGLLTEVAGFWKL